MASVISGCRVCLSSTRKGIDIFDADNEQYLQELNRIVDSQISAVPSWPSIICGVCQRTLDDVRKLRNRFQDTQETLVQISSEEIMKSDSKAEEPDICSSEDYVGDSSKLETDQGSEEAYAQDSDNSFDEIIPNRSTKKKTVVKAKNSRPTKERLVPRKRHEKNELPEEVERAIEDMKSRKPELDVAMKDTGMLKCHICQEQFDQCAALYQHIKDEHKCLGFVWCCDRKFFRIDPYAHMLYHQDNDLFKCAQCEKRCYTHTDLKIHNKTTHLAEDKKRFSCTTCGKKFATSNALATHQSVHLTDDEKSFKCTQCPYASHMASQLKDHIVRTHEMRYAVTCETCGMVFKHANLLEKHKQRRHMDQYSTRCEDCGKNVIHMKHHKAICKQEKVSCGICGKLVSPNYLKTHQNVHSDHRAFQCHLCEKTFRQKGVLKDHIDCVHLGLRKSCLFCPAQATYTANNISHMKQMHAKEYQEYKERKKYQPKVKLADP